mgnify:CR=1 FL=1
MIAIIDYDAGNIKSVEKALQYLGEEVVITRDPEILLGADKVILPGVGAFGDAMSRLNEYGLIEIIHKIVEKKTPFWGICLGLQLLFDSSEEAPGVKGLGILPGKIVKFPTEIGLKIPQIGWNNLDYANGDCPILKDIPSPSDFYFVHSYVICPEDASVVKAYADYGIKVPAVIQDGNTYACQFHPEKSGPVGLKILKNFCEL